MPKYDVFISCKSEDYNDAREIYNFLTSKHHYNVFLADAELRKSGRTKYGKVIDEALEQAEHLIVYTSKIEYVTTPYVEDEWRTFLEEQRSGRKKGNLCTILKNCSYKELPISLRHLQYILYDEFQSVVDYLPIDSASGNLNNSKTYKVGDYYNDGKKEGIVFEVTQDGKHGKIVSKSISGMRLEWCIEAACGSIIGTDSELDGAYNMSKIQAIPDWQNKFPAFKWCADLGEGWYIPSRQEMCDICKNAEIKELISPQDDFNYFWSSTEYDKFNAWFIGIKDCYNDNFYKHQLHHIVAVSKF